MAHPELTPKQVEVLTALSGYAEGATVRQLRDRLERPAARTNLYSYDEIFSRLRACQRKGFVTGKASKKGIVTWKIKATGTKALARATKEVANA